MEKYKEFLGLVEELVATVEEMEARTSRKEVDELELKTRRIVQSIENKFAHVQGEIHDRATECRATIVANDTKASFGA